MAKKKKFTTAIAVGAVALALLLGGTFAWQSISQMAKNEAAATVNPGGRLHDDFDGSNKDVYVENFADTDIFARVRLDEYFVLTQKFPDGSENRQEIAGMMDENGKIISWEPHVFGQENLTDAYWAWDTDGSTVFMPTFNKNKDSLVADVNGSYLGQDGVVTSDPADDRYSDYYAYAAGEDKSQDAIYDYDSNRDDEVDEDIEGALNGAYSPDSVVLVNETHIAKPTLDAELISMQDWMDLVTNDGGYDENLHGNYWVYDTDGWVYWSAPIESGTATGLLLDSIKLQQVMDDSWYYAIKVIGQFITALDMGYADGTGFYADPESIPTDKALELLKYIGVDTGDGVEEEEPEPAVYDLALNYSEDAAIHGVKPGDQIILSIDAEDEEEWGSGDLSAISVSDKDNYEPLIEGTDYTYDSETQTFVPLHGEITAIKINDNSSNQYGGIIYLDDGEEEDDIFVPIPGTLQGLNMSLSSNSQYIQVDEENNILTIYPIDDWDQVDISFDTDISDFILEMAENKTAYRWSEEDDEWFDQGTKIVDLNCYAADNRVDLYLREDAAGLYKIEVSYDDGAGNTYAGSIEFSIEISDASAPEDSDDPEFEGLVLSLGGDGTIEVLKDESFPVCIDASEEDIADYGEGDLSSLILEGAYYDDAEGNWVYEELEEGEDYSYDNGEAGFFARLFGIRSSGEPTLTILTDAYEEITVADATENYTGTVYVKEIAYRIYDRNNDEGTDYYKGETAYLSAGDYTLFVSSIEGGLYTGDNPEDFVWSVSDGLPYIVKEVSDNGTEGMWYVSIDFTLDETVEYDWYEIMAVNETDDFMMSAWICYEEGYEDEEHYSEITLSHDFEGESLSGGEMIEFYATVYDEYGYEIAWTDSVEFSVIESTDSDADSSFMAGKYLIVGDDVVERGVESITVRASYTDEYEYDYYGECVFSVAAKASPLQTQLLYNGRAAGYYYGTENVFNIFSHNPQTDSFQLSSTLDGQPAEVSWSLSPSDQYTVEEDGDYVYALANDWWETSIWKPVELGTRIARIHKESGKFEVLLGDEFPRSSEFAVRSQTEDGLYEKEDIIFITRRVAEFQLNEKNNETHRRTFYTPGANTQIIVEPYLLKNGEQIPAVELSNRIYDWTLYAGYRYGEAGGALTLTPSEDYTLVNNGDGSWTLHILDGVDAEALELSVKYDYGQPIPNDEDGILEASLRIFNKASALAGVPYDLEILDNDSSSSAMYEPGEYRKIELTAYLYDAEENPVENSNITWHVIRGENAKLIGSGQSAVLELRGSISDEIWVQAAYHDVESLATSLFATYKLTANWPELSFSIWGDPAGYIPGLSANNIELTSSVSFGMDILDNSTVTNWRLEGSTDPETTLTDNGNGTAHLYIGAEETESIKVLADYAYEGETHSADCMIYNYPPVRTMAVFDENGSHVGTSYTPGSGKEMALRVYFFPNYTGLVQQPEDAYSGNEAALIEKHLSFAIGKIVYDEEKGYEGFVEMPIEGVTITQDATDLGNATLHIDETATESFTVEYSLDSGFISYYEVSCE